MDADIIVIGAGVIVRFVIIVSKVKRFSIMRFLSERFLFSALAAPTRPDTCDILVSLLIRYRREDGKLVARE